MVCVDDKDPYGRRGNLRKTIEDAKGVGLILIIEDHLISRDSTDSFPLVQVGKIGESHPLINYMNSTV